MGSIVKNRKGSMMLWFALHLYASAVFGFNLIIKENPH